VVPRRESAGVRLGALMRAAHSVKMRSQASDRGSAISVIHWLASRTISAYAWLNQATSALLANHLSSGIRSHDMSKSRLSLDLVGCVIGIGTLFACVAILHPRVAHVRARVRHD
jgi:hypothetical protein